MTYHARIERKNRIDVLEETLGFTKTVLEVENLEEEKRFCLTSSGVIIIKNLYKDIIITAYMANVDQCYRLYRMSGKSQIAPKMLKRVLKNQQRHSELFSIKC